MVRTAKRDTSIQLVELRTIVMASVTYTHTRARCPMLVLYCAAAATIEQKESTRKIGGSILQMQ